MATHSAFPEDVAVDVLLVGAGPAGYMAAVTLARYGVDFRMIDQRAETIQGGQAGGKSREPYVFPSRAFRKKTTATRMVAALPSFISSSGTYKTEYIHVGTST